MSPAINPSRDADGLRPTLRIAIIVGSTRPGRLGTSIAEWACDIARQRDDAQYVLVDVADFNLPVLDEGPPAMLLEKIHGIAEQYSQEHTPQVGLSLFTDLQDFTQFRPAELQERSLNTMLDHLVAWSGAMRSLREPSAELVTAASIESASTNPTLRRSGDE